MAAALLLALAGAQKLLDPTLTIGALSALRLPSGAVLVRVGAFVELVVGIVAIVVGGALWWLVAASYLAFTAFVALAIRRRVPIGTCGCFGRAETLPSWSHVRLNLVFLAFAVATALLVDEAPSDDLALHPAGGTFVYAASAAIAAVAYAIYVGYSMMTTTSPEPTD
jgi:hypothetical protein